jgi:hypothetical protein
LNLWVGAIEGHTDVGAITLFIRQATLKEIVAAWETRQHIRRFWFCKEFTDWASLQFFADLGGFTLCVETTPLNFHRVPTRLREKCQLYLKLDMALKKKDHICIGPAFSDESFCVGSGAVVRPAQYSKDIRIL